MTRAKRYHISPRTGDPMMCNAQNECPFNPLDSEENHWDTPEEARAAFEKSRSKKSLFPELKKSSKIYVTPLPKSMRKDKNTFIVPRGVYIIGDPYNILRDDPAAWYDWQNIVSENYENRAVGACYDEHPVIALEALADVVLHDSMGRAYSCSSGYIGLVPISLAKQMNVTDEAAEDDGYLLNFNEDTEVEWLDGNLCFGERLFMQTEPDQDIDVDDDELYDVDDDEIISGEAPDEDFLEPENESRHEYSPFSSYSNGYSSEETKDNKRKSDFGDFSFY